MESSWILLGICFFVLLSSFFTCSETALFSLTPLEKNRLQYSSRASCRLALRLLQEPHKLLTTLLMGNELADVASSALASWLFLQTLGPYGKWIAYPLMTAVLFIWGDLFPKVFGLKFRIRVSCVVARPLWVAEFILAPLRLVLLSIAQMVFRVVGLTGTFPSEPETEEEIRHLVEKAYLSGAIGEQERLFIYSLFESEDTPVSAIMTPRQDIYALKDQEITPSLLEKLKKAPFHKIPVHGGNIDQVLGILYLQDLLKVRLVRDLKRLSEIVRPPFFVSERTRVRTLLEEFQHRHVKMALVVDEYGRISGLVTLEDALEELFGEIYREAEEKEPPIQNLGKDRFKVKGRVQIEDFNREIGAELPEGEFKTLAGLVLHLFGRLPQEGEEISAYGFRFRVEKRRGYRLEELLVEREKTE